MKKIKVETVLLQRIVIFLIVILSFVFYRYTWKLNKNEQLNNLLRIAGSIEATFSKDDIKALEAKSGDTDKPQYHIIKDKLKAIIQVNNDARFAYLFVERNNKVYFLADSEPEDSKDYSPPGQEYVEADTLLLQFFKDGKELITGTFTDRWGRWKSVLIPIKDGVTGKNIAVFGMDFSAQAWNRRLYYEMAESSALTLLLLLTLLFLLKIQVKNKLLKREIAHRKHAAEKLQQYKEQLEFALSGTNDGVWDTMLDTGSFWLSPRGCEILGYKPGELNKLADNWIKMIHPDDLPATNTALSDYLDGKVPLFITEQRMKTSTGDFKWILARGKVVSYDKNGKAERMVGTHTDISERKRAELALHESNERLKIILENNPIAIWDWNIRTDEWFATQKYYTMLGCESEDEYPDRNKFLERVHPDDRESVRQKIANVRNCTDEHYSYDARVLHNDGSYRWHTVISQVIERDEDGKVVRLLGVRYDTTEQKQAEEALQFRNVLMATQQQTLIEGILAVDNDNKIISYNHRFIEMWGIPKALIEKGKDEPVLEYVRNKVADSQTFIRQVQCLYEHKDLKSHDEIILANGSIFDRYSAPMIGPGNRYYGRIWSFHDITKYKHADGMLRLQSDAMQAAIDGLAILDASLNFIYNNNSHARIYGYNDSIELIGASWHILYDESESQRFGSVIIPELNQKGYYQGRATGKKKNGNKFPQTISLTALENGGVICFVRDITDQMKIEDELIKAKEIAEEFLKETQKQKSEIELQNERLESLLRISQYKPKSRQDLLDYALKEAIKLTSSSIGHIYYCNETNRQVTLNTWSKDVMKECSIVNQQKVYDLDETGCWVEAIRQRKPFIINNFQDEYPRKKGFPKGHVQISRFLSIPVFIDNEIVGLVGVANKPEDYQQSDIRQLTLLMDAVWRISERENMIENLKIAKEHAEESDRLKSAFLANMSHEIRTPMNGILGFAGLLKEPRLTGEEQMEYIDIIEKSGARMLNIINDIMSISKVESGQMEVSVKETNINEQIEYIYTFFKPEAEQKGIQLSIKKALSGKKAIIRTDKEKVYAILTNLVKNAIKFTHTGTIEFGYNLVVETLHATSLHVTSIQSTFHATFLQFYVKDTGIGINKEQKDIIFERFRQGSESLNRNYEGAGLGLAISKAYVEMLGGKIRVESNEGKGSVFYFTLPYNGDQEENILVKNVVPETATVYPAKSLKILIAEDDESSNLLIKMAVSKFASEIFNVKTGTQAVEICRNNTDIDLVLMDIRMPEMDGYEATKQIRKFNTNVIIIAQTAFALYGDREKAIDAGCNDYISKPINKSVLISLLNKHFEKNGKEVILST